MQLKKLPNCRLRGHLRINLSLLGILLASQATSAPVFVRVMPELDHQYIGGWEHFVGGGVAVFDCNGDTLADLYLAGGEADAILLVNQSGADVAFAEQTPDSLRLTGVIGAYPFDFDNDGWLDLFVLRVGENLLMKGLPDCQFQNAGAELGYRDVEAWSTAFSATWEDGETFPTFAVGNYVDRNDPNGPFQACDTNYLYRPSQYDTPIALDPGYCPLSMLFTDWGRNGRQDLRVSNDRHYYVRGGEEQMWAMEPTPRLFTEADGWRSFSIWGMGIASEDLTGDGLPEIYLSSMGDQKFQMLDVTATGPTYQDATYSFGTTAHRPYIGDEGRPSTGWHIAFGDVDNDGRSDAFIAKGNVEQMPDAAMEDPNNLLMQQPDGTFAEIGDVAGIATTDRSRGATLWDFNNDGLLDIAVVNRRAPVEIYQNRTADAGNWIAFNLRQDGANRFVIGGWIEVQTPDGSRFRELVVGGGHAGGGLGTVHVGLGSESEARLRVHWPDGGTSDWVTLDVNQPYQISRSGQNLLVDR